jgi:hypothetical protein
MPAIETKIWLALRARTEALTLSPVHVIAWPNEPFTPPSASGTLSPYLAVRHLPNQPERLTINRARHRFTGILQIDAMYPIGIAEVYAREIAGLIAEHFPADLLMPYDGINVRVERQPDVSQGFLQDTMWRTPVSIRYDHFQA